MKGIRYHFSYIFCGSGPMAKESEFQSDLIKELKLIFPGCIVLKNDPNYIQGIPDLLILYEDKWAGLECKRNKKSNFRPNQKWYISKMNEMSYCSFISPENKEEVLNEIQRTFQIGG